MTQPELHSAPATAILSSHSLREAYADADIRMTLGPGHGIVHVEGFSELIGYNLDQLEGRAFIDLVIPEEQPQAIQILQEVCQSHELRGATLHFTSHYGDKLPFILSGYARAGMNEIRLGMTLIRSDVRQSQFRRHNRITGLLKFYHFVDAALQLIQDPAQKRKALKMGLIRLNPLDEAQATFPLDRWQSLMQELGQYLRSRAISPDLAGRIINSHYALFFDPSVAVAGLRDDLVALLRRYGLHEEKEGVLIQDLLVPTIFTQHEQARDTILFLCKAFAADPAAVRDIHDLLTGYERMRHQTAGLVRAFKQTVQEKSFDVAIQPIVSLQDRRLSHFEALVRFAPALPFENPFHFVTFGEEQGLIGEFDIAMCERLLTLMRVMKEQGRLVDISMNLSAYSLMNSDIMQYIHGLLRKFPDVAPSLMFELTESAPIDDLSVANDIIQILRQGGNAVCLDDFGTGEASFDYLKYLQMDLIKIDGSYIRASMQSKRGRHLLAAVIDLCRSHNETLIGEMVEDEEVSRLLALHGIKFGQGYYFGRPDTDIERMLREYPPEPEKE